MLHKINKSNPLYTAAHGTEGFLHALFYCPVGLCCVVNNTGFDEAGHLLVLLRHPRWPPSQLDFPKILLYQSTGE